MRIMSRVALCIPLVFCCAALTACVYSQARADSGPLRPINTDDLDGLAWRSVGPANMGGRIAAIAMAPDNPKTYYVGFATGGLWKTTNAGTTFAPIFDDKETSSIGSVAVVDAGAAWPGWKDEKNPVPAAERADKGKGKIVWVGTGEGNGRNSSSWGHGVYRSTDAGASFTHVGLADSHDIPALAVDPRNPDVAYVAALGHLWGPNKTRGVYKTSDGGANWQPVLRIDEHTGACDVVIDPANPNTVYAAMYMRRRSIGSYQSGGPKGGVYKSTDAGKTWKKLQEGLPAQTGRIGLAIAPEQPNMVYAVIESDEGGKFSNEWNDRSRAGGVFRSQDGGASWQRMNNFNPRAFYFSRIAVAPDNPERVYLLGWQLYISDDGGRNFRAGSAKVVHVDAHALVINPRDPDHLLLGNDGGLYVSHDRGKTWDFHNHLAVGQFYNVAVDHSDPYRIGGGLQDNGTWMGPSETITTAQGDFMGKKGSITNQDWQFIFGGDGFHVAFDPENPHIVYAESQGGRIKRIHLDTGLHYQLTPAPKEGQPRFRFNWNTPFFISPHDPSMLYVGGNYVFRLTERGDRWQRISDDLSRRQLDDIVAVGSNAETAGTITALAESSVKKGLLWAGTDDGLVHVSSDGGQRWNNVTPKAVKGYYIARIEPSHHEADTAYVAVDGHRSDFFAPILLMTRDNGDSWQSIVGDLPKTAPPEVIREDPKNPDVLYVGTEQAVYVTVDRGAHWIKLNGKSLPTVPVDDLVIQPREMDLVAGTHGRSVWVLDDISPISQLTTEVRRQPFHVFAPMPARPRYMLPYGGLWSDRMFIAQNPPPGAAISYWIRDYADEKVTIQIKNANDHVVVELTGANAPGINRVYWDLQAAKEQRLGNPHNLPEFVPPGTYTVAIKYGDHRGKATLEVLPAPRAVPAE